MRQGLAPISAHIDALNKAYAHLDNAIDSCTNEQEYSALLDRLEERMDEPYMDILYQHAWEIIQTRIKGETK